MYKYIKTIIVYLLVAVSINTTAQYNPKVWHWLNQLGGSGWDMSNGIVCNSKNNIYIAGGFSEELKGGNKSIVSEGNRDIYVARYNQEGKLEWLWQAGGSSMDKITAIKEAPDDDLYITGLIDGDIKFDDTSVEGEGRRLFVSRITKKGKCDWVTILNYSGQASGYLIDTDNNGNLILSGVFTDNLSCGDQTISSKGHQDIFLLRINSNGQLQKLISYGSSGKEKPTALSTDNLGHVYLSAQYTRPFTPEQEEIPLNSTSKTGNSVIFQVDNDFNVNWFKTIYSESYITIKELAFDMDHHLLLGGNFNHTLHVDTLSYTTQGLNDLFVAKADSLGNIQWLKTFGGKYNDEINQVKLNKLGGLLILGSFTDSLQLDTTTLLSDSYYADAFVAQMNSEGTVTWCDALKGDKSNRAKAASLDNEGNLYLTGTFKGTLTGGNTELSSMGIEDIYVAKYYDCPDVENAIDCPKYLCEGSTAILAVDNSYSQIIWNDSIKDLNRYEVSTAGIYHVNMVDRRGCVVADTISLKEAKAREFSLGKDTSLLITTSMELSGPLAKAYEWQDGTNTRNYHATCTDGIPGTFNYKLTITDSVGCEWNNDVNIEFYEAPGRADLSGGERLIKVFPNPVKDQFAWSVELEKEAYIQVEIRNASAVLVYSETIDRYIPNETFSIDISNYMMGIYYFSIASDGDRITKKLIKL